MSRSMFIGRYQPFHKGHLTLINKVLIEEKGKVVIALRDTPIQESDPYSIEQRIEMIKKFYPEAAFYPIDKDWDKADVVIVAIPDIAEVVYGRKVGWGVRQLVLDPEIEAISATKIRESMKNS